MVTFRLLQEFVQKHEGGLEVVYALSGWLKSTHPSYHIRLVAQPKLAGTMVFFKYNNYSSSGNYALSKFDTNVKHINNDNKSD